MPGKDCRAANRPDDIGYLNFRRGKMLDPLVYRWVLEKIFIYLTQKCWGLDDSGQTVQSRIS
jgi:hypothetical protein